MRQLDRPGARQPAGLVSSLRLGTSALENTVVPFASLIVRNVGGGHSAVEAAIELADQPRNKVHISYRQDKFSCIKSGNQHRIEEAIRAGKVVPLWQTNLTAITSTEVAYKDKGDAIHRIPNSQVFTFAGGELPTPFLRACGAQIETKFGER